MNKNLSELRRRVNRLMVRVAQRQDAYKAAPRGKRTRARELLDRATSDLRRAQAELTRASNAEVARLTREKARKERERERLRAEVAAIRKKQEIALGLVPMPPPVPVVVSTPIPIPAKPPKSPALSPQMPPPAPGEPSKANYPERVDIGGWLRGRGWKVFFFEANMDDWNASKKLLWTQRTSVPITELSDYIPREHVWWRADIRLMVPLGAEASDLITPGDEKDDSLGRPEVDKDTPQGFGWRRLKGGTHWHRPPADLDVTISTIVDNLAKKYLKKEGGGWLAKPEAIEVSLYAASRDKKPAEST